MTTQETSVTMASAAEMALIAGDLAKLSPQARLAYYKQVCESLGLNPLTRPFEYIVLNGRLTLYARRDAADQLRRIHGVSIEIVSREIVNDLAIVHVRAKTRDGRTDEEIGIVSVAGLRGEALANALLKSVTKAKRRVTLSICGLGWLDETEVESIPEAAPPPALEEPQTPVPMLAPAETVQSKPAQDAVQGKPALDAPQSGPAQDAVRLITDKQKNAIFALARNLGLDYDTNIRAMLREYYGGKDSVTQLTVGEASDFIDRLNAMQHRPSTAS